MTATSMPSPAIATRLAARSMRVVRTRPHGTVGRFDRGDMRTIVQSFGIAAGLVLAAALTLDAHLLAVVLSGPVTLETMAGHQIAIELLPWCSVFTGLAGAGVSLSFRFDRALDHAADPPR